MPLWLPDSAIASQRRRLFVPSYVTPAAPVAYSSVGVGANAAYSGVIGWVHNFGANDNCAIAGVGTWYTSGGYSNFARTCGIVTTPVAWDSTGTTGIPNASYTGGVAQTFTHTISTTGTVTVVVAIGIVGDSAHPWSYFKPTSITFNGNAMTEAPDGAHGNNNVANATGFVGLYYYTGSGLNGDNTVSITLPNTGYWWAMSSAYTNVGTVGSSNSSGGSGQSPSATFPNVLNSITVCVQGTYGTTCTGNNRTLRGSIQSAAANCESGCLQDAVGTAATTSFQITTGGASPNDSFYLPLFPAIGISFTSLGVIDNNNAQPYGWVELYGLVTDLPSGNTTIIARQFYGSTRPVGLNGCSVAYTGVGNLGTPVTNYGTSTSVTTGAIPSNANHMIAAVMGVRNNTLTISGSGTQRYKHPASASANYTTTLIQDVVGASPSVELTATAGATPNWGTVAVDLEPAA